MVNVRRGQTVDAVYLNKSGAERRRDDEWGTRKVSEVLETKEGQGRKTSSDRCIDTDSIRRQG